MANTFQRFAVGGICAAGFLLSRGVSAQFYDIGSIAAPTNATEMIYSPAADALVLKNSASAIVVIDLATLGATTRLANTRFTDMSMSPSGQYVFGADYGGENIGYGTPAGTSYVHRVDLVSKIWEQRTAYIAGQVQAVSDTQVILKSIDQWVTFTNNAWGSDSALIPLNTPGCCWGPGYYAIAYSGDFRFDVNTWRLLFGNSGLSSQEVQAWKIVNNEFVTQEGSGTYGSAQGHGGSVVLATDGSAFYYGDLQIDPLDLTHNRRVFPEVIVAATGQFAFGNGKYYDAHTGQLLGTLPFTTTVYALNRKGTDFWAYDSATTTVHHFSVFAGTAVPIYMPLEPCRIMDTRIATLASGVQGPILGNALYHVPGFVAASQTWGPYGGAAASNCGLTDPPGAAIQAVAVVATILNPNFDAYLGIGDANSLTPVLSNVALNYTHGQGLSTIYMVPQIASSNIYFALPAGLSAQLIFDVVGYYIVSDATALQCTIQTSAASTISASGGTGSATTPVCGAGYTLTSGGCDSDSFNMNLVQDEASGQAWFCSAMNSGGTGARLTATANCCRVGGK